MEKIHQKNTYKDLLIDCKKCSGLCCVSLYFAKSEGFPTDKAAGTPCRNLMPDFRCTIHGTLIESNLKGCLAYDCLGAGQKVTQRIYDGKDWKTSPEIATEMFQVFLSILQLHQMLWYLVEASTIILAKELKADIDALIFENEQMTQLRPEEILNIDSDNYRGRVNEILKKTGKLVADAMHTTSESKRVMNFIGKNFKKANLRGKDLSMTLLIAANLEGCNLYGTNFLGADLRDANIKNTDLSESVFLTQGQINSAKGNHKTKLPTRLVYPTTWQKE